jgi:hypothetical protein
MKIFIKNDVLELPSIEKSFQYVIRELSYTSSIGDCFRHP